MTTAGQQEDTFIVFGVAGTAYALSSRDVQHMEMVEGVIATQVGDRSFVMFAARWLEEVMEMCGVLLFVAALLRYIAEELPEPLVQDYRRGLR